MFGCPPQQRIFFKSKAKLQRIVASISPNKGANKSTLQKYLYTSLKPVLKCKQVENNNFRNIFLKDQNSQRTKKKEKKKLSFGILKIRGGILLYSKKLLSSFQKLWAGSGGQPINFSFSFFGLIVIPAIVNVI